VSKIVVNNPENFPIQTLNRFKDIAVFVVGSFLLPHPVYSDIAYSDLTVIKIASPSDLGSLEIQIFNCRYGSKGQYVSPCAKFRAERSNTFAIHGHFVFGKMTTVRHLGFLIRLF